jgi:hypothetical protein
MMICIARGGGGGVLAGVSVLWGAGGGLAVQPEAVNISAPINAATLRGLLGTSFRVAIR